MKEILCFWEKVYPNSHSGIQYTPFLTNTESENALRKHFYFHFPHKVYNVISSLVYILALDILSMGTLSSYFVHTAYDFLTSFYMSIHKLHAEFHFLCLYNTTLQFGRLIETFLLSL